MSCDCGRVDGPRLRPGDGQCPACWTARHVFGGRPAPAVTRTAAAAAPPACEHFAPLPGAERERLGLGHAREWGRCGLGLTLPGGRVPGVVCPCQGCGPACPGYAAGG